MPEKKCNKCGLVKPTDQFNKAPDRKGGLHCYCRKCLNTQAKRWRLERIERNIKTVVPLFVKEKLCSICKTTKPAEDFYHNRQIKDGLDVSCRECKKESRTKRLIKNKQANIQIDFNKTKICSKCGETKTLDCFFRSAIKNDGVCSYCKECANKIERKCLAKNRERNLATGFVEKQLTCFKCKQTKSSRLFNRDITTKSGFTGECKSCHSFTNRFALYGVRPQIIDDLTKQQNGRCAICGDVLKKRHAIDHCHQTQTVRGILCLNCNSGIGLLRDSPAILQSALSYLEQFSMKGASHVA